MLRRYMMMHLLPMSPTMDTVYHLKIACRMKYQSLWNSLSLRYVGRTRYDTLYLPLRTSSHHAYPVIPTPSPDHFYLAPSRPESPRANGNCEAHYLE